MNADPVLIETVELLLCLARRAGELAASLPALELPAAELPRLAGEVQRVTGRLADVEEGLAAVGPVTAVVPEDMG